MKEISQKKSFFLTVLVLGTGLKGLNINEFSEIQHLAWLGILKNLCLSKLILFEIS